MAEYGTTVADVFAGLKEAYEETINTTFNSENFLMSQIGTDTSGIQGSSGGRYKVQALKIDNNPSAGSRGENDLLPEPGKATYERTKIDLTTLAANTGISGLTKAVSNSSEKAISQELTDVVKETYNAAHRDFNRKLYKSSAGNLFQVTVVDGDGTPGDPWVLSYADSQVKNNRWVVRNERIQFGTVTDGVASVVGQDVAKVVAISPAQQQFTAVAVSGTPDPSDGDWVFAEGSVNNALVGLEQALEDTDSVFQDLDPADYGDDWKPVRTDADGASLTVDLIDEFLESVHVTSGVGYLNGADDSLLLTDRAQARELYSEIEDQIRFNNSSSVAPRGSNYGEMVLPTGHRLTSTPEAPSNELQLINKNDVKLLSSEGGWHFLNGQASHTFERRDNQEIILVRYCQLAWTRRNSHGQIHGLA
jgi:hypothetical protein